MGFQQLAINKNLKKHMWYSYLFHRLKTMELPIFLLMTPAIISILIILIACDWFICHTYLSVGINPCVYHNWKTNISSYVQTSDQYYHCISYIYSIYD